MDNQLSGQINFEDYFKPPVYEKPKELVFFINDRGVGQYREIQNVITELCEREQYDMPDESINRITNAVSVWLLGIGAAYEKYLAEIMKIEK